MGLFEFKKNPTDGERAVTLIKSVMLKVNILIGVNRVTQYQIRTDFYIFGWGCNNFIEKRVKAKFQKF